MKSASLPPRRLFNEVGHSLPPCPQLRLARGHVVPERDAWLELARVSNLVSFEPDEIMVFLDGRQLAPEPGQSVTPHGIDRALDPDDVLERGKGTSVPEDCLDVDHHVFQRPGAADQDISI